MADPDTSAFQPDSPLQLLAEEVVLELPAVEQTLTDAVHAAAAGVGLSCGITYRARYGVVTVASSDDRASAVDEIQYGAGHGPCLEALQTAQAVRVDDLNTETRWGHYRDRALQAGVRSSLSVPVMINDQAVAALNVYSSEPGPLPADQEAATFLAASQVAGVLLAAQRLAADLVEDPVRARALQTQHELNIATGILMGRHDCSAAEARAMLGEQAATENIPLQAVVSRLVTSRGMASGSPA